MSECLAMEVCSEGNKCFDVEYLGCFKDSDGRALHFSKGIDQNTTECIELCEGYKYVGRQYFGECWCENDDNYDKHGEADDYL